jgi:ribose transport system permease protein
MKKTLLKVLSQSTSIIFLFVIMAIASVLDDTFTTTANATNVLQQIVSTGIVTIGLSIVNITGGFDISVGATMALTGVITMMLMKYGVNVAIAMTCGLLIGLLVGFCNGFLIGKVQLNPFVATLSISLLVRGVALGITDARPISVWNDTFGALAYNKIGFLPFSFLILVLLAVLAEFFIKQTKTGHNISIYGSNKEAGFSAGINMDRTVILTYTICGLLASVGGFFLASKLGTGSPIIGDEVPLIGTAAIIIGGNKLGGKTNMFRSIIGVVILGILNNMLNLLGTMSYFQIVARGLLVVLVIASSSEGIKEIVARVKNNMSLKRS